MYTERNKCRRTSIHTLIQDSECVEFYGVGLLVLVPVHTCFYQRNPKGGKGHIVLSLSVEPQCPGLRQ